MAERLPLIVVGAGPAGLAAAATALEAGVRTVLLDEQSGVGGQIYRHIGCSTASRRTILGSDYTDGERLAEVAKNEALDYRPRATVWEVTEDRLVYCTLDGRAQAIAADQVILCAGAQERPMPIPGWTLPGVMTCGAGQILLKSAGVVPTGETVIAGSGPLLLLLANQLLAAGTRPAAVVETTPAENYRGALRHLPAALRTPAYLRKGVGMLAALKRSGVPWFRSSTALQALGEDVLEGLRFSSGGRVRELRCGALLLHQGVVPNVQFSRALGLAHDWDDLQRCWRPRLDRWGSTELEGIAISGDSAGIMGAKASEHHGRLAALGALQRLGELDVDDRDRQAQVSVRGYERENRPRAFLDRLYRPHPDYLRPADDTVVCRCEEVTAGQIREYVRLGCLGPNQAKAFGRSGMGPCQGRVCGLLVSEIIADERRVDIDEVGYYRIRSPIKPLTLGELAAMDDLGTDHADDDAA